MKKKIIKEAPRFALIRKGNDNMRLCLKHTGYDCVSEGSNCKYHCTSIYTPFTGKANPNDLHISFGSKQGAMNFAKYWDKRSTALDEDRNPTYIQDNFKAVKIGA